MRVAVFADIHGNHIAFKKCVEYALNKGCETFVLVKNRRSVAWHGAIKGDGTM